MFILLLTLAWLSPLFALDRNLSSSQYALRIWGKRDGLPGSWVYAVLPSRSGYVWLATPDGLLRFDGARFKIYNRKTSPGLPSEIITALCEGRDGRLWVGTSRGLSAGPSDGNGPFTLIEGAPSATVRSIVEMNDGSIWAATSQVITRIDGEKITKLGREQGLPGDAYRALRVDTSGVLWIATNGGIARFNGNMVDSVYTTSDGLVSNDVLSLIFDREGRLWAGTGQGVARRASGGRFERVTAAGTRVVQALFQDRDGNVWAGTRDGLLRAAGGSLDLMGRADGLADEHISALAEDADGNLWIGTEAGGIARLRDGRATVYGSAQGLTHEVVWSVLQRHDGSVWVGTDGGGLNRLRGNRAVLATSDKSLEKENIYALFEDRAGRLWFSTEWQGLCRLEGGRITRFKGPFIDDLVRCLLEDREGRIWVGTSTALMRMDGNSVIPVPTEDGRKIAVLSLLELPSGTIWIGTTTGLARLEGDTVRRVVINGKPHVDRVNSLFADPDETLWIGTADSGLQRLRDGHLASVTAKQGMPSDTVLSVLCDRRGRYWVSTGQGIYGIERNELDAAADGRSASIQAISITEAEGLRDRECSGGVQPSAWLGSDNRIWYPTIAGVAVIDTERVGINTNPPRVLIEELVADGVHFPPGRGLILPAGTRHLEIHYASPNFIAPERVRFQHQLKGLDPAFVEAGSDRVAYYVGRGPGRYSFRVRAANEDGVWDENGTAFEFSVRPFVWETGWFYSLCGIALLVLIAAIFELRVRSVRAREGELKRRVAEEMARVRILSGMLPICAWCKKVRDDAGYWNQIEAYIRNHSEASFTHGICPDCAKTVAGEIGDQTDSST